MNSTEPTDQTVIAVDIGGTKIATAVITTAGEILRRSMAPTLQEGPQKGIRQIIHLIEDLVEDSQLGMDRFAGIGIGIPAVLEPDTDFIIWGPNLAGWRNVDLSGALKEHFQLPVCIEYDGHAAVMGEWWKGAARGLQSVVSIIIGTGVGGGMVLDGKLIRGINRLAGAAGWFILDHNSVSDLVKERALGSWESRTAGPGIAQRAEQYLSLEPREDSTLRRIERKLTAEDVFKAAKQGDALAVQITSEFAGLLGMGIANIVSLVNPEMIVLGGSVGSNSAFLLPQIKAVVDQYAQPVSCQSVKIVTSLLGADAGLYGAAYGLMLRLKKDF